MRDILSASETKFPSGNESERRPNATSDRFTRLNSLIDIATGGRLFLPLVVFLSISLRFWTLSLVEILSRDGFYYCVVARKIQDGHWLDAAQGWFIFNPYPPLMGLVAKLTGWSVEYSGQFVCALSSALGVIPLYLWVKSAFSRRIAVVTSLLYACHPILLRTSGEVLRDGLYWLTMLTGVYLLWESVKKLSVIRAILGGLAITAATLTRIEGIAIFPLVLMWCLSDWLETGKSLRKAGRLALVGLIACAMLPFSLIILNASLLPKGSEWQGVGRFQHQLEMFLEQIGDFDEARSRKLKSEKSEDDHEGGVYRLAAFETFRFSPEEALNASPIQTEVAAPPQNLESPGFRETSPSASITDAGMDPDRDIGKPRDVRDLAKSLPVWDRDGGADPVWYRLQRFLVMADDQAEAVYLGVFLNRLIQGLLIPVLIFFYLGLRYQRKRYWKASRDWPLLLLTVMLFGVFYFHLTTEHVLEARYLFCLIPFVFPWTAIGAIALLDRIRETLAELERSELYPRVAMLLFLLTASASMVHAMPRNDPEKTVQREMGEHIRAHDGFGRRMTAPESLKRMAYYADTWYFMLPRQVSDIGLWLKANPMDYVVLGGKELPLYARLIPQLDTHQGYQRIFTEDSRFLRYYIYRSKALGNFSPPRVAPENRK